MIDLKNGVLEYSFDGKTWKLYVDGELFKETDHTTPFIEWFVQHTISQFMVEAA